ncbi:MAG: hypothetical protein ACI9ME_002252, partial [Ilumatobacter sp.]
TPGSSAIGVLSANDLKPLMVRFFRYTAIKKLLAQRPTPPTTPRHTVPGTV